MLAVAEHETIEPATDAAHSAAQAVRTATQTPTSEWETVLANWHAAQVAADTWEDARADNDDSFFPNDLRRTCDEARAAMLDTPAPHWAALGEKALLLQPYFAEDCDDGWRPDPEAKGVAGWWGRLVIQCAEMGAVAPEEADYLDVLKVCGQAECVAREALNDRDSGYRAYAVNPSAVSEMAGIIGTVQEEARDLANRHPRSPAALVIGTVWFDQVPGSPEPQPMAA